MRIEKYIFPCLTEFAYGDPAKRESKSTSFTLKASYPLWRPPFWGKTRRPPPTPRGLLIPAASPSGAISDSPSGASGQSLPGNSGRPPGVRAPPGLPASLPGQPGILVFQVRDGTCQSTPVRPATAPAGPEAEAFSACRPTTGSGRKTSCESGANLHA